MMSKLDGWIGRKIGCFPLTRQALVDDQLAKLKGLLAYAKEKSAFYGYLPGDIECLDQLANIPLIHAEDVQKYAQQMICVSQSEIKRIVTMETSGTTAPSKRFFFTEEDQELTVDFFACGLSEMVVAGDRVLIMMPCTKPGSVGLLIAEALSRLGVEVVLGGVGVPFAQIGGIEKSIDGVVGMPASVLALARYLQHQGRHESVKGVLLSADYCPALVKEILKDLWGCKVYEHYGSTESGLGGAVSCQVGEGMHIRENDLLVEIIDEVNGRVLADGQWGELVITTLTRRGMPLIRYRTGDRAKILPEPCPCGSVLKRLAHVEGRLEDSWSRGMNALDERLLAFGEIIDYQASYQVESQTLALTLLAPEAKEDLQERVEAVLNMGNGLHCAVRLVPFAENEAKAFYMGKRRILRG